jgi:exodeoxyribonuclease V alpha subunit
MVELEKSHRFDPGSGIGSVAMAVKRGDAARAVALLSSGRADARLVDLCGAALEAELGRAVVQGFGPVFRAKTAGKALEALEQFRLLSAHRRGARGVEGLNRLAERVLVEARLLKGWSAEARFYPGRPVMVVENDYQLELFNGDVGIVWPGPGGALAVHFATKGGATRPLPPSRLPEHETVFATSIHKSQGSELDEVAIVLPEVDSPLLSRELFYTALTRARSRAVIYGNAAVVVQAVERRVRRDSGLAELLWGRAR